MITSTTEKDVQDGYWKLEVLNNLNTISKKIENIIGEIESIARFASGLKGVKKMHILPYHRLGQDKYEGLGREYLMHGVVPPTNEHMKMLQEAAIKVSGIDCQIGG